MKNNIKNSIVVLLLDFLILLVLFFTDLLSFLLHATRYLKLGQAGETLNLFILIPLIVVGIAYLINLKVRLLDTKRFLKIQLLFMLLFTILLWGILVEIGKGLSMML